MGRKGKNTETVSIRFPKSLYLLIKEKADFKERSISQQVVYCVKQYFIQTKEYKALEEIEREDGRANNMGEESGGDAASSTLD